MPLPFGAAENVFGASFTPVGRVTVWMMSRPLVDVGKPENWKMKFVPRLPRVGTGLIVIVGGGGGGGRAVRAGVAGAALVDAAVGLGATAADLAPAPPDSRAAALDAGVARSA